MQDIDTVSFVGDSSLASNLISASQRARVVTEAWVAANGYCVACSSDHLIQTPANTHARDFECDHCKQPYELKSSASTFGRRIVDGAYGTMITRIRNGTVPNLLLLQYGAGWKIESMWAVHHVLITENIIEKRPPLSANARRAGWIGCNILLSEIPPEGKIPLIAAGEALPRLATRSHYEATENLSSLSPGTRGWTSAVLSGLHRLGKTRFTIQDAYSLEAQLSGLYPQNRNIKPKIRQQLQVLRDAGLISFEGRGEYHFSLKT
jgi:type II restriction enzyme